MSNAFKPPRFSKGEDPYNWLQRFERAAKLNKWDDDAKLYSIEQCFLNESTKQWYFNRDFSSWNKFVEEFTTKYHKKVDADKIIKKIMDFKIKKNEPMKAYIERFDKLSTNYKKMTLVKTQENKNRASTHESKEPVKNTKIENPIIVNLSDKSLIRYFINGLKDRSFKRFLKYENPDNLENLYKIVSETCDSDEEELPDDSESESMNSDSENSNESEFEETKLTRKSTHDRVKNKKRSKDKNVDDQEMTSLLKGFEKLSLMMAQAMNNGNYQPNYPANAPPKKTSGMSTCYNCQDQGHKAETCPETCKLCKQPGHPYYHCERYQPKKTDMSRRNTKEDLNTGLFIDLLYGEKRQRQEEEGSNPTDDNISKKAKIPLTDVRVSRSGNQVPTPAKKRPLKPMTNAGATGIQSFPQNSVTNIEYNKNKRDKSDLSELIQTLVHQPNYLLSLSQIASFSAAARTLIKSAVTKPQENPRSKLNKAIHPANLLLEDDNFGHDDHEPDNDYSQEEYVVDNSNKQLNLPPGNGAPKTIGTVNGVACEMILDSGCTPFIISKRLALEIGTNEVTPTDTELLLGNGKLTRPLGVIENLKINVGDIVSATITAICLDVDDRYDFIIGRIGLHLLGVSTDWTDHSWHFNLPDGSMVPAQVYYGTKEANEKEEPVVPGFILIPTSDDEDVDHEILQKEGVFINEGYQYLQGEIPDKPGEETPLVRSSKEVIPILTMSYP
ncbi:hypothetical protein EDC96DRAFT_605444 [Choanephora cucurbitarum]|nr:hypothetical protein EDC96DRAFT_605444 [Choanephora cucurbitarum]